MSSTFIRAKRSAETWEIKGLGPGFRYKMSDGFPRLTLTARRTTPHLNEMFHLPGHPLVLAAHLRAESSV